MFVLRISKNGKPLTSGELQIDGKGNHGFAYLHFEGVDTKNPQYGIWKYENGAMSRATLYIGSKDEGTYYNNAFVDL